MTNTGTEPLCMHCRGEMLRLKPEYTTDERKRYWCTRCGTIAEEVPARAATEKETWFSYVV